MGNNRGFGLGKFKRHCFAAHKKEVNKEAKGYSAQQKDNYLNDPNIHLVPQKNQYIVHNGFGIRINTATQILITALLFSEDFEKRIMKKPPVWWFFLLEI
jgi:hypothetical protein